MKSTSPNYKKIYTDIILMQYPNKLDACKDILFKKELTALDVIKLNEIIFKDSLSKKRFEDNQKHRSYDERAIVKILEFQRKNNLNNTQISSLMNISRNTISKWKKNFIYHIFSK